MVLIKCILAGLASVVLAAGLTIVVVIIRFTLSRPAGQEGVTIGFDPVAAARNPSVWLVAMGAFALGFYMEYRRAG